VLSLANKLLYDTIRRIDLVFSAFTTAQCNKNLQKPTSSQKGSTKPTYHVPFFHFALAPCVCILDRMVATISVRKTLLGRKGNIVLWECSGFVTFWYESGSGIPDLTYGSGTCFFVSDCREKFCTV
jgi:hypothetical protein